MVTINTILQIIEMEFKALESPTSPFISAVKPGTAEPIGLKAKIIIASFASNSTGRK
jgi:hypothetical protein